MDDLVAFQRIIILNNPHLPGINGPDKRLTSSDVNKEAGNNVDIHRRLSNSLAGSRANIAYHYDLSNDLYSLFLDPTWAYSSAVYRSASESLEEA